MFLQETPVFALYHTAFAQQNVSVRRSFLPFFFIRSISSFLLSQRNEAKETIFPFFLQKKRNQNKGTAFAQQNVSVKENRPPDRTLPIRFGTAADDRVLGVSGGRDFV
jgi:hypothetical protein